MLTLIVKGDIDTALKALDARGVAMTSISTHNKFNECIVGVRSEFLPKVVAWFCEPGEAPFHDGALTFYSEASK